MKAIATYFRLLILFVGVFTSLNLSAENFETSDVCNEEEVNIILNCPYDVTVSCTDEIWDLSIYGNATYYQYGTWYNAGPPVVNYNLNSCNAGTITRTWSVEDYNWNIVSCTQTITVSAGYGAFNESNITWPQDNITLEGCYPSTHPSQLPPGWGYPTWTGGGECSSIGVSYSDQIYTISSTCKKIVRKWQVMDWCQYNPNSWYGGYTPGLWTHYQFIKISKGDVPYLTCVPDITVNSSNCVNAYVNLPSLEVDGEACGGNFDVSNNSVYATSNGANASGTYPIGWHTIKYTVQYGCGQKKTCTQKIKVTDKKPPTPYCYASIVVALMPVDDDGDGIPEDGMVEIWAKDLDKGSSASCNGGTLKYSFSSDPTNTFKVYTCADVGENIEQMWVTDTQGNQAWCQVTVIVQNNGANIPDCEPQDDDDDPDDGDGDPDDGDDDDPDDGDTGGNDPTYTYYIGGEVTTVGGQPLDSVKVTIVNNANDTSYVIHLDTTITVNLDSMYNASTDNYTYMVVFDTSVVAIMDTFVNNLTLNAFTNWGHYRFAGFAHSGEDFTLSAMYNDMDNNSGINTADLDFLMKYIVGDVEFTEAHQKIASDVDRDGDVDFDDLKKLLEYLTGDIPDFGVDSEWVIVDATQLATQSAEEVYNNPDLTIQVHVDTLNIDNRNFVAIRLGDIVIDAAPGILSEDEVVAVYDLVMDNSLTNNELEQKLANHVLRSTSELEISAYPNPFDQSLNIEYHTNAEGEVIFEVWDISGSKILSEKWTVAPGMNTKTIHTTELAPGMITYRIVHGTEIISGKALKVR